MYSPRLLDHFQHPRNSGGMAAADATVQIENPACGDVLELAAKLEHGRIVEIRFRAKGCVASMACGSALTELVKGKALEEAARLRRDEIVRAVDGLPEASSHAAQLAFDALHALLQQLNSSR
jgi:NifU-like protein involved in Fe-S cluster formation